MKVIDLLNKIANGEEVPKFWWNGCIHEVQKEYGTNKHSIFDTYCKIYKRIELEDLNEEIKFLEEDKKIEKYDTGLTNGRYTEDSIKTGLDTDITIENIIINMGIEITLVKEKMFEIIDKINSMEVK